MTVTGDTITIHPVRGLPEVVPGDDLPAMLARALREQKLEPADGDVLVVAQKVVSKAEGARVALDTVRPSPETLQFATRWNKDPRMVELVLRETRRVVRRERGLIISETRHGFICANAGIDLSNSGGKDIAILLPEDSDRSAEAIRASLAGGGAGPAVGVIVADTFGRPWRVGLTQVALGVAGLAPLVDLRAAPDVDGRTLHATIIAVADELACAADLVCGKTTRVPAALIRGYPFHPPATEQAGGAALIRDPEMDLFR